MAYGWHLRWAFVCAVGTSALCGARADEPAAATSAATQSDASESATGESAHAGQPAQFVLKYKFRPEQTVRFEVTQHTRITTLFNDATHIADNKSQSRRRYRVVDVAEDGSGDLELTIDWVRMEASFGDGDRVTSPIVFQSDDSTKHPEKFLHILDTVGKPRATIRFSPAGLPIALDASVPAQQAAAAASVPGSDATAESYLLSLPANPIATGEGWNERFTVTARNADKFPVRIDMLRSYKLKKVENGLATIDFRTAILTPVEDPAIQAQLIQREMSGALQFDIEHGLLLSRDIKVDQTVVNFAGPKSSLRAVSTFSERLLPEAVAAGPGGAGAAAATQK